MRKRVIFICTQNAGRSQMAEGYLRTRYGDRYEAFSAGTHPTAVSRKAIMAMEEIGVDISASRAKPIGEFAGQPMDVAVMLCDNASALCPVFPGAGTTLHRSFPDPGRLSGTAEDIMDGVREIRDRITGWIDTEFG